MERPQIQIFEFKKSETEFIKFGSGKEVLLAFHGFGRDCFDWLDFDSTFGKKYTIYSFNLCFHGNSTYARDHYKHPIEKSDVRGFITSFSKVFNIEKFALLAYSLGGRVALTALERFEDKITAVYLFAPDGVKNNWYYEFGANTWLGQNICKLLINSPQPVLWLAYLLNKTRLLDDRLYKFVTMHMSDKSQRKLVFNSWVVHRELTPKLNKIRDRINLYRIPIHIFVGKYDKIITPKIIRPLSEGIDRKLYHFTILKEGHNLIRPKTNKWLEENYLTKI